ncbi:ABC transporter substrate-binding protein [Halovulum dunhuangense]|uniref:ABC transporter substrate-binding protein n=1 Tax=Halovulum dunhuangense TaxID=1505036 RepID=A0A849L2V9_9RHOB|nr:ABC transporter substrate-binding protein [Halovulum dunhuangense]NNU80625.1 ABC transporter substrate-binding protein [Halovulum dunhuangense]
MTSPETDRILARMIEAARRRRLGRRGFMQGALATGMGVGAATGLWTGQVMAQTPKRGGIFRVGINDGNTGDQLDPGLIQSIFEIQISHCHRSWLTEITDTNQLGPDLATGWSAAEGAAEWRFELARDVTFHSGRALTAADVVASLNHHRGAQSTSAAASLLADVTDVRADGDHAVIITLAAGNADLPYLLSDYHIQICPANEDGSIDWQSGDGTGPYRIVSYEPGVGAELERHEGWHREGAWFDGIRLTVLNDPNARQTALVTGEVDAIATVDLKTVGLLQNAPGIQIDDVASGAHVTMPMFCDVAPFDNLDVRLAMKYAINREELIEKILFGYGSLGNDHPIAPSLPYWADLPQREYDPERARFHMDRAGLGPITVDLSTTDSVLAGGVDLCVLFAEQARAAGITINVVREPADGYWSNVWLKKPFSLISWGARPTPDVMFSLAYKADAAWNESHWQNERFNELLALAKAELDDTKRAEMYAEMQLLCRDDGGTIVPFFQNRVMARRDNVMHGPNIASNWEMDGARAYHRWWFA